MRSVQIFKTPVGWVMQGMTYYPANYISGLFHKTIVRIVRIPSLTNQDDWRVHVTTVGFDHSLRTVLAVSS